MKVKETPPACMYKLSSVRTEFLHTLILSLDDKGIKRHQPET